MKKFIFINGKNQQATVYLENYKLENHLKENSNFARLRKDFDRISEIKFSLFCSLESKNRFCAIVHFKQKSELLVVDGEKQDVIDLIEEFSAYNNSKSSGENTPTIHHKTHEERIAEWESLMAKIISDLPKIKDIIVNTVNRKGASVGVIYDDGRCLNLGMGYNEGRELQRKLAACRSIRMIRADFPEIIDMVLTPKGPIAYFESGYEVALPFESYEHDKFYELQTEFLAYKAKNDKDNYLKRLNLIRSKFKDYESVTSSGANLAICTKEGKINYVVRHEDAKAIAEDFSVWDGGIPKEQQKSCLSDYDFKKHHDAAVELIVKDYVRAITNDLLRLQENIKIKP